MSIPVSQQRGILTAEEFDLLAPTRQERLRELDREELLALARRVREGRDRLRTVARDARRARRGKAEPRGDGNAPAETRVALKKEVFATALKRVNSRLSTLTDLARREHNAGRLHAVLARERRAVQHHPASGRSAGAGMRSKASDRGARGVNPGQIGGGSGGNREAQARRDSR